MLITRGDIPGVRDTECGICSGANGSYYAGQSQIVDITVTSFRS